ncbi:acyltransferase [Bradyrhizobium sp. WSM1417]|uniref:acyltransferase family protein n=1 Tax=Bradyrhizobium sp. WSM1417 TaxID=754500 RepID=UPI000485A6BC|nr:acyltransferase [Bradyrhizobium sp. WSM1417]
MSEKAETEKSEYFPAFDVLRIVLASMVAFSHSGAHIWYYAGDFSVQVFFALSGWLIGGILLRSKQDLPRFYFHRAARIWIPYSLAISLLVIASLLKDNITLKWFEFVFYDFTFVYNFFGPPQLSTAVSQMPLSGTGNHFWSICAEEQFYLLAPFLITVPIRFGRSVWFWCAIAAVTMASPWWSYFGSISLGVLAAVIRAKIGDWHSRRWAIGSLAVIATSCFAATYRDFVPYRIGAPATAISIVMLLAQRGPHSRVLSFLGGISFPMYLNHWIATFVINAAFSRLGLEGSIYSHSLSVMLGLIIASALFLCVDRVIKLRRDQYFTPWRGKVIAACGFGLVAIGMIGGASFPR